MLVHDLILNTTTRHGDRPALTQGKVTKTFSELADEMLSAANGFARLGVLPGDRIGVLLNKRHEAVLTYFAASTLGAIFVPINPKLKGPQVRHILSDCNVSVLVTTKNQAIALADDLAQCPDLRDIIAVNEDWQDLLQNSSTSQSHNRRIDNDVAAIFYTSGSTGRPKGVVLSHRNITDGAMSVSSYIKNTHSDVILSVLPLSFDAGFSQLTTGFYVGAHVVLLDYILPRDVAKSIAAHRVTGLTGVPPLWNQLKTVDWPPEAVESLRYIANTGGAMPTNTLKELRRLLPNSEVFLMYGLTESFRSTYLPPSEVDKRPTSIGKAIPNAEVLVVREDGTSCAANEPGELVHRGALVSLGYWNDPEKTAIRFRPAPKQFSELPMDEIAVWSGDTVYKDDEGYLYFVGRRDDMIKSSGYRISPTEIEEVIFATGNVVECAALGIADDDIGQSIVVVAQSMHANSETAQLLLNACKTSLPSYMVPARVEWRESLPRNPNGKIDRKALLSELEKPIGQNDS